MQLFCDTAMRHVRELPRSLVAADAQLAALFAAHEAAQATVSQLATAVDVANGHGAALDRLTARLDAAEKALGAMPAWCEAYKQRMAERNAEAAAKEEAAGCASWSRRARRACWAGAHAATASSLHVCCILYVI
jgi:hypothetical protein